MRGEVQRLAALMLVTVVIAVTVATLGPRLLGLAAGPEGELITLLKKVERDGLEVTVAPFGTLRGEQVHYQRLSVTFDGNAAVVTGTLDFTGHFEPLREGATSVKVSSLGLERIVFRNTGGDWVPERGHAPRLTGIVRALEQRRRTLSDDPDAGVGLPAEERARMTAMTRRVFRSDAWYIRSERESVEVTEDYRLTGDLPERPIDEKASRRLTLSENPGGLFVFVGG